MNTDDNDTLAVTLFQDLSIIRIGDRDRELPVSLRIRKFRSFYHIKWDSLRIQDIVPSYGIQDHLERRCLHQTRYPAAHTLEELGLCDDRRSAPVGGYHRGVDDAVLQRGAEDLGHSERDVVRGPHHPVLGAEAEVPDAELHVLTDHLGSDLLRPETLGVYGTVIQFGFADLDDLSILDHHTGHPDRIENVSSTGARHNDRYRIERCIFRNFL